jgi:hypothetical protein
MSKPQSPGRPQPTHRPTKASDTENCKIGRSGATPAPSPIIGSSRSRFATRTAALSWDRISVEPSQSRMSAIIQGAPTPGNVGRLQPVTGAITVVVVGHKRGMLCRFKFRELAGEQTRKTPSNVANASRGGPMRGSFEPKGLTVRANRQKRRKTSICGGTDKGATLYIVGYTINTQQKTERTDIHSTTRAQILFDPRNLGMS